MSNFRTGRYVPVLAAMLMGSPIFAQEPQPFTPPKLNRNIQVVADDDPGAGMYESHHQAAVAALKAGNQALRDKDRVDRAINLFILSLSRRRDPSLSAAIYNLGVACERQQRWSDALNFYQEVGRVDPNSDVAKLAQAQVERVQFLMNLELTDIGKRKRRYDIALVELLGMRKDPVIGIGQAQQLANSDNTRWEALAFAGVLQASLGQYAESSKSLERASRLATGDARQHITAAAETARQAAQFQDYSTDADSKASKKEYESAAQLYAKAWDIQPSHVEIGERASVAYLMADELDAAVRTLARIRKTGPDREAQKATAMLQQLTSVSAEAKTALNRSRTGSDVLAVAEPSEQIEKQVGQIASQEVNMIAKPAPPPVEDKTEFLPVEGDPQIKAADASISPTENIFARYQAALGPTPEPVIAPDQHPEDFTTLTVKAPGSDQNPQLAVPAAPVKPEPKTNIPH